MRLALEPSCQPEASVSPRRLLVSGRFIELEKRSRHGTLLFLLRGCECGAAAHRGGCVAAVTVLCLPECGRAGSRAGCHRRSCGKITHTRGDPGAYRLTAATARVATGRSCLDRSAVSKRPASIRKLNRHLCSPCFRRRDRRSIICCVIAK
jgi:hypothetical protein